MEYFVVIMLVICACVTSGCFTFVKFDAKLRQEAIDKLEREKLALMDTNIALSKSHNMLVEAQKSVAEKMESLELRLSGLVSVMPQQRKY